MPSTDQIGDIRAALAANLASIANVQISPYRLSDPTFPSIQVAWPEDIKYHEAMHNGMESIVMIVMAFGGTMTDIGAQKILDQLITPSGATSVKAAIESDPTLGGHADDLIVVSCTGYREYAIGQIAALGCEWRVEVTAPGS
jgi:hypothetical protein